MTPRKNTGSAMRADATPARPAIEWVTARLAQLRARRESPPPVKAPHRTKLDAPRASWWSAFSSARLAVRSGIPLDEFLRHRLSRHLARLPVPPDRLPVTFEVDAAGNVVSAPARELSPTPWLEAFLREHGHGAVSSDVLLGHADAARLAGSIDAQRRRVDELTHVFEDSMRGVALADPADRAQAEQMGRPAVPRPTGVLLQVFGAALLVAESWPIAIPCLKAAGVDVTRLAAETERDPFAVLLGSLFALGASAALFLLAHVVLRRLSRAGTSSAAAAVGTTLGVGAVLALGWASAAVHGGSDLPIDGGYPRVVLFLASAAIPFTGAWLLAAGRQLDQARAAAVTLARTWDQEHYRTLAEASRDAAMLSEEERRLARLEAERSAIVHRTNLLQQRAAVAERLAADAAGQEQQELSLIAQALAAALEQDRYEWVRQASARGVRIGRPELAAPPPVSGTLRTPRDVPDRNLGLAG